MLTGTIVNKSSRGFAFIRADGQDYFAHCTNFVDSFEELCVGDRVTFEPAADRHGRTPGALVVQAAA